VATAFLGTAAPLPINTATETTTPPGSGRTGRRSTSV
jgi:hypothetical protein